MGLGCRVGWRGGVGGSVGAWCLNGRLWAAVGAALLRFESAFASCDVCFVLHNRFLVSCVRH